MSASDQRFQEHGKEAREGLDERLCHLVNNALVDQRPASFPRYYLRGFSRPKI